MLTIVQFYCRMSLSVYGSYFFISLIDSSLDTGLNGTEWQKKKRKANWKSLFNHRVLPSKHLKFHFRLFQNRTRRGPGARPAVKSKAESAEELEFVFCHSNRHPSRVDYANNEKTVINTLKCK